MSVYLVGYDLNKSGKDYKGLFKILESFGGYWHHLDSTWLIVTDETVNEIYNKVKPHIDADDTLLIVQVTSNYTGWMTQEANEWLLKHL